MRTKLNILNNKLKKYSNKMLSVWVCVCKEEDRTEKFLCIAILKKGCAAYMLCVSVEMLVFVRLESGTISFAKNYYQFPYNLKSWDERMDGHTYRQFDIQLSTIIMLVPVGDKYI